MVSRGCTVTTSFWAVGKFSPLSRRSDIRDIDSISLLGPSLWRGPRLLNGPERKAVTGCRVPFCVSGVICGSRPVTLSAGELLVGLNYALNRARHPNEQIHLRDLNQRQERSTSP